MVLCWPSIKSSCPFLIILTPRSPDVYCFFQSRFETFLLFLFFSYFQTTGSKTSIAFITMRLSKEYLNSSQVPSGARMTQSVELCDCPREFTGDSCQHCAEGYTRLVPNSGPYTTCVPCSCYGNSDRCDSNTGVCIDCQYNTTGLSLDDFLLNSINVTIGLISDELFT